MRDPSSVGDPATFRINLMSGGERFSTRPFTLSDFLRAATSSSSSHWNRRNYYRVLNVQPEAPMEIIQGSYNIIVKALGKRPDSPGKHSYEELLGRAYSVVADPEKRAAYDEKLKNLKHHLEAAREQGTVLHEKTMELRQRTWERYRKRKSRTSRLLDRVRHHGWAYALILVVLVGTSVILVRIFETLERFFSQFLLYY